MRVHLVRTGNSDNAGDGGDLAAHIVLGNGETVRRHVDTGSWEGAWHLWDARTLADQAHYLLVHFSGLAARHVTVDRQGALDVHETRYVDNRLTDAALAYADGSFGIASLHQPRFSQPVEALFTFHDGSSRRLDLPESLVPDHPKVAPGMRIGSVAGIPIVYERRPSSSCNLYALGFDGPELIGKIGPGCRGVGRRVGTGFNNFENLALVRRDLYSDEIELLSADPEREGPDRFTIVRTTIFDPVHAQFQTDGTVAIYSGSARDRSGLEYCAPDP